MIGWANTVAFYWFSMGLTSPKGKGEVKEQRFELSEPHFNQSSTSFIYSVHRASTEREDKGSSSLTANLKTTG